MGRRTPRQIREVRPPRRHRADPDLPFGAVASGRVPQWMRGEYGQGMAEAAKRYAQTSSQRYGPRTCAESGKRRYADELAAARALAKAQRDARRDDDERRERRIYECNLGCGGWHLTSKDRR